MILACKILRKKFIKNTKDEKKGFVWIFSFSTDSNSYLAYESFFFYDAVQDTGL